MVDTCGYSSFAMVKAHAVPELAVFDKGKGPGKFHDYQQRARGLHKIVTGPPPSVVQIPASKVQHPTFGALTNAGQEVELSVVMPCLNERESVSVCAHEGSWVPHISQRTSLGDVGYAPFRPRPFGHTGPLAGKKSHVG
jgi:hypothetical protein